jgi:hypothetical protein
VTTQNADLATVDQFLLSPNPAHDFVEVKPAQPGTSFQFTLRTIGGGVVRDFPFGKLSSRFDISGLAPGIYLAEILTDSERWVQKLIVW